MKCEVVPAQAVEPFYRPGAGPARVALFLSGAGSNAAALLEFAAGGNCSFAVTQLVTDAPETSAARQLGRKYGIPVVELDIRTFYRERGEESIRLDSDSRRRIRDEWSAQLWELVRAGRPDFGVLAGFMPLTNIAAHLHCLNVHPGDLRLTDNTGARLLAGLHIRPVERAILSGHDSLRSSVILAQHYSGSGEREMDSGPLLGVSAQVPVDLEGVPLDELRRIFAARSGGSIRDRLREIALANVERLKRLGDHVVLPRAAAAFAAGRFGMAEGALCFLGSDGLWRRVLTVEFSASGERELPPGGGA